MRVKPTRSLTSLFAAMMGLLVTAGSAGCQWVRCPGDLCRQLFGFIGDGVCSRRIRRRGAGRRIGGKQTILYYPGGLTVGQDGRLYVTNYNGSVTEYAKGASGNVAPVAVLSGPDTGLTRPQGIVLDSAGHLFVANYGGGSVTEYAKGADIDDAPIATIKGPQTGLENPAGVTIAPDGEIVVADSGAAEILRFKAGATGDVAPVSTLKEVGRERPASMRRRDTHARPVEA